MAVLPDLAITSSLPLRPRSPRGKPPR